MVYEEYLSVGDKVLIPVGDGRCMRFTILKFDGTLSLMEADENGENIKRGEKMCYRLNGKEKRFYRSQLTLSL